MPKPLDLRYVTFMAAREPWAQFSALTHGQGQSLSAYMRILIAKELRRAAKEARAAK